MSDAAGAGIGNTDGTEEVFDIPLRRPQRQNRFRSPLSASREFSLMWMPERFWLEKMH